MAKGKDLKARIFAFIAIAKAKLALAQIANLPKPMVYQGTIGQGGTVPSLPADPEIGDTYIVITDGTYGSFTARVGDIFVYSESGWTLVPTGDIDTWRNIFVDGTEVMSVTNKDPLKLVAGTNISLAWDSTNKTITISTTGLASVATSGDYNDLNNLPTIPAEQVQSDWSESVTTSKAYIKNKPTVAQIDDNTTSATALWSSSKTDNAKEDKHYTDSKTLTAGQTTVTFTNATITANALVSVYANAWYTNVDDSVANTLTYTFPVQSADMRVSIEVK